MTAKAEARIRVLAADDWLVVPAVGAGGRPYPLATFEEHLTPEPGIGVLLAAGVVGFAAMARPTRARARALASDRADEARRRCYEPDPGC
ncbi:MAG: hypothetical protein R3F21_13850 [Myxococcota bacterium]